jgi:TonB family protein
MKRNRPFCLAIFMVVTWITIGKTQLAPPIARDNSTKETRDGEPVYEIGHGVTNPRPTYQPMPEYDQDSRKKKKQGTVVLSMIVTKTGQTGDVTVERSLSTNLDTQAVKAVSQWRFSPATKDGDPVAVHMHVEVSFNLAK